MEYDIETNNTVFRNYYDFTYRTDYLRSTDFILASIRNKLTNAVKKRFYLIDQLVLLSGGLISLVCGISKIYKDNKKGVLNTFAIGIEGSTI